MYTTDEENINTLEPIRDLNWSTNRKSKVADESQ